MPRRVRVVFDPPCDARHGIHKGRVCDVLAIKPPEDLRGGGYWVMGDMGKPVLVMNYEACDVEAPNEEPGSVE